MNALIIEDGIPAANRLESLLTSIDKSIKIVDILTSTKSAIEWFSNNPFPDVIFMDIELSDGRSFEIFKHVMIPVPVIFTTAYDQFAIKAIKINALDYLLKPIDRSELSDALEKLKATQPNNTPNNFMPLVDFISGIKPKKIVVKDSKSSTSIEISDIVRFEADSNYSKIFLVDKTSMIASKTLKDYEDILGDSGFFRIHHSHLISLHYVIKFYKDSDTVEMINGNKIEVSRSKKKELLQKL